MFLVDFYFIASNQTITTTKKRLYSTRAATAMTIFITARIGTGMVCMKSKAFKHLEKVNLDLLVEESELGLLLTHTTDKAKTFAIYHWFATTFDERRLIFSQYLGAGTTIYRGGEIAEKSIERCCIGSD